MTLVVRRGDLRKSMSSYLSERVLANGQITVRYHTQVAAIEGTEHIRAVHLRDDGGNVAREDTTGLFIFIGARPRTDFLPPEMARDDKGFALTGADVVKAGRWHEARPPEPLETSLPGVFASGDCRSGDDQAGGLCHRRRRAGGHVRAQPARDVRPLTVARVLRESHGEQKTIRVA